MDDTFDILFEPMQIGPVVAPNRFYQCRIVMDWGIECRVLMLPCAA